MALDPAVEKILEIFKNIELSDMKVEDVRDMMSKGSMPQKKEQVKSVKDSHFEHHGFKIPCRLYEPENSGNELIIYFHGGGFIFGDRELFDGVARRAAKTSGCKVLSVEYRLAPEHKFPAAVDDAYEAYLWVRKNSETLCIDPGKIAMAGDSAGANLTVVTGLRLKDNKVALPKLQTLFYPVLGPDLFTESLREYGKGYFLTKASIKWFGSLYLNSDQDFFNPLFSPILREDLSGLPETIIVTAEHDPLRDQGEMYLSKLYDAGVPATGIRAKGLIHGFLNFSDFIPAAEAIASMVWYMTGQKLKD
jgi:acetyl esterase